MAEPPIRHGDIQRALIEANEVCQAVRFYSDGSVWEVSPSGWVKHGYAFTARAKAAILWGLLDQKARA